MRRAIIWADQRAERQAYVLGEKIEEERFYKINGHRNTASYGIQKAMWIKEEEPEIYRNTYKFLNAKDYMVFRLTGKFYTDCSDANSMDCFELSSRRWSEEIVEASGVDIEKLPEIVESVFCVGNVTAKAAKETGLSVHTKVIMGAGDGVAANVGAGCVTPADFIAVSELLHGWLEHQKPLFLTEKKELYVGLTLYRGFIRLMEQCSMQEVLING